MVKRYVGDAPEPRQAALWTTTVHDVDPLKSGARKLAGTKLARTDRDPARIKRTRKVRL